MKGLIIQSLLHQEEAPCTSPTAALSSGSFISFSRPELENDISTHVWKGEEDALVNLRHDKNKRFLKTKNHKTL